MLAFFLFLYDHGLNSNFVLHTTIFPPPSPQFSKHAFSLSHLCKQISNMSLMFAGRFRNLISPPKFYNNHLSKLQTFQDERFEKSFVII